MQHTEKEMPLLVLTVEKWNALKCDILVFGVLVPLATVVILRNEIYNIH